METRRICPKCRKRFSRDEVVCEDCGEQLIDAASCLLYTSEELRDNYLDPYGEFADYVLDMDVRYDAGSGLLTVLLPVTHKTTGEVAVVFGEAVLKTVGASIATQNFYYEAPDEDETDRIYYGSYFDEHDVCVQVFYYDQEGKTDTYLVNDTMKAGEQRALTAQNQ